MRRRDELAEAAAGRDGASRGATGVKAATSRVEEADARATRADATKENRAMVAIQMCLATGASLRANTIK